MTDFSALPRTFDVLVRRPVSTAPTRFYRFSLHSTDYRSCLDEVETLFPGVDTERLRRIYEGKEKPGVGISGDVAITNTDHYSTRGKAAPPATATRRKTALEVMASVAEAAVAVNSDLRDTFSTLASFERRENIPPEWHAADVKRLTKWACRLSQKIAELAGQGVSAPPALPPMPAPPVLKGDWPFAVGGEVELPCGDNHPPVELTLNLGRDDGPAWGEPLPLSQIKF